MPIALPDEALDKKAFLMLLVLPLLLSGAPPGPLTLSALKRMPLSHQRCCALAHSRPDEVAALQLRRVVKKAPLMLWRSDTGHRSI